MAGGVSKDKKVSFAVYVNEGAFFHEPWLHDIEKDKHYRYDRIPPRVAKKLAHQMSHGLIFDKSHVEILCYYITTRKGK